MNMVSLFSLKSSGHREGVPVSGRFTSMTLPRREAARDSSILIDRSWAMIKDWRNTDDGATYYAHMTDKFFENIATLPQAVTDFFASAVDDSKGETNFDLFVWLVREANEHAAKRKNMCRWMNTKDPAYKFGKLGFFKGMRAEDLEAIEIAFLSALQFVVGDFVRTDDKRAMIAHAWGCSLRTVISRMLKAFPLQRRR
ncbi:unnamed protein product [Heterosigma akashiwo]|mmetsp:Transcript_19746/g.34140  ORF Transcript_19746/g.34140 Transcript_19746/m.34140 type:complete len:198 (+) Transcript_19746:225-818(+)